MCNCNLYLMNTPYLSESDRFISWYIMTSHEKYHHFFRQAAGGNWFFRPLIILIFPSRVSVRWYKIGPVCVCLWELSTVEPFDIQTQYLVVRLKNLISEVSDTLIFVHSAITKGRHVTSQHDIMTSQRDVLTSLDDYCAKILAKRAHRSFAVSYCIHLDGTDLLLLLVLLLDRTHFYKSTRQANQAQTYPSVLCSLQCCASARSTRLILILEPESVSNWTPGKYLTNSVIWTICLHMSTH